MLYTTQFTVDWNGSIIYRNFIQYILTIKEPNWFKNILIEGNNLFSRKMLNVSQLSVPVCLENP